MSLNPIVTGAVVPINVPDGACFENFAQLIRALGTYLAVQIPNQDFSNLVISPAQPGVADIGKIWAQISNAGTFIGFKAYANSVWNYIYPLPGLVEWILGDSASPPAGWKLLESSDTTGLIYAHIMAMAYPPGLTPPYTYYPAIFIGF